MINIALFGNPNVGKTTVFNLLTGSNQYVGNWPGVTIEKKEGYLNEDIKIVDLPGIYAMDTFSNEEKVSKSFLENEDVDVILNIVDASNLSRNLYLTTQLMKYNKPIILLLNMLDLAGIPLLSKDRKEDDPIIVAGGPCAYNPEPLAPFIDFFYIGEGELAYDEILDLYKAYKQEGRTRSEVLEALLEIEGLYVPGFYEDVY